MGGAGARGAPFASCPGATRPDEVGLANPVDALPRWSATGFLLFARTIPHPWDFARYVCAVDPATKSASQLQRVGGYSTDQFALSPNGRELALTDTADLVVVDLETGTQRGVAAVRTVNCCIGRPRWSSDGERLAFSGLDVYVVGRDGSGFADLGPGGNPEWSPRSSALAYSDAGTIMVRDEAGAHAVAPGAHAAWSPDGRSLAIENHGVISVAAADGSSLRRVADGTDPAWSPDGTRIAFAGGGAVRDVYPGGDTFTIAARGGSPAWSPDGLAVAYVAPDACGRDAVWIRDLRAASTRIVTNDCRIIGTPRADDILGTASDDLIRAGGGDDFVVAGEGRDVIYGGPGDDALDGGLGYDRLYGGPGNDYLRGDYLVGGPGHDVLLGQSGSPTTIDARDGARDVVRCGTVPTVVYADRADAVAKSCKHVIRR